MKNTISVIIPVYNRQKTIKKAVQSVLNQTFQDFELLLVDDCSTDNSIKEIEKFKDSRIRLFKLDANSGAAAARNRGILEAKGNYISLLDSDDHYEPEFLEETLNILASTKPNVGFSWTGVRYMDNENEKEFIWQPKRMATPYLTFLHSLHIGSGSGITFKKEVFTRTGLFNDALPASEDTDLFLRISQIFDYTVIPKVLINIERDKNDRLSKNFKKIAEAYNFFIGAHMGEINKDKILQRKYYYKLMWLNYHLGEKNVAREYYKKIPRDHLSTFFKSSSIYIIYEILNIDTAKRVHRKISSYGFNQM